ncbi:hypothetical protein [Pseudoalteromonas spongiae]|uniref:Uncharacterized protein n=1 Tax=Pseudoalteromonas spongiae TaxID=298657 RepID=A0ABU8ERT0_9GAMM
MKINPYTYIYYHIYKLMGKTSDLGWFGVAQYWRASVVLIVLSLWVIGGGLAFIASLFKWDLSTQYPFEAAFITGVFGAIFNYFLFHRNDNGKKIISMYEKLPKRTNYIGGLLVLLGVLLCSWLVIESFQMYGEVAKKLK